MVVDFIIYAFIIILPAPIAGIFMKKLFSFISLAVFLAALPSPSWAFDRNSFVRGARVFSNSNFTYNINSVNISLNSGPVLVGSTDHNLPAYAQIAQITAQIQALKDKLKNFSPK